MERATNAYRKDSKEDPDNKIRLDGHHISTRRHYRYMMTIVDENK